MNAYIDELKRVVEEYPSLTIHVHSINRSLITILKQKLSKYRIGFAVTGTDFTFIDVDYYVLLSTTQNDLIIDTLLKSNKEVIIYVVLIIIFLIYMITILEKNLLHTYKKFANF